MPLMNLMWSHLQEASSSEETALSFIQLPLSLFSAAGTQLKIPNRFLPVNGTVLETGEIPVGRSGGWGHPRRIYRSSSGGRKENWRE